MATERVSAGDPLRIRATDWNLAMESARAYQTSKQLIGGEGGGFPAAADVITVMNATGAARARFDALALAAPAVDPSDNEVAFLERVMMRGTIPTQNDTGRFAILLDPLPPNEAGRAVVAGATIVRVRMVDEANRFADVQPGQAGELLSGPAGSATLLWVQPAAERQTANLALCVARIGGGGAATTVVRHFVIIGHHDGAFGVANSGFNAHEIIGGIEQAQTVQIFVMSYDDTAGNYGRVNLTADCWPFFQVGDHVRGVGMEYAGVQRTVLLESIYKNC